MPPEANDPRAVTERAIALWSEIAAAYDVIEQQLASGRWEGFAEVATHLAGLEQELEPLLAAIAARRDASATPPAALADLWRQLERMVEALARRRTQLERAATGARDTTAARLVRTRIARSRASGYAPLNPLTPRLTSRRV
ncbi:MAG: hypothetical protein B6D46_10610 [Polyangiaceae bacterium UTPRO1]|jgi:ABC-type transporter Mla subunit MlaD|nr:hypothetical protein [Myxococcales bacterium]OQY66404.1 MAG: hypothetical protein B6D46_10610 [Polyangiaceae bacterium UTPRO1]